MKVRKVLWKKYDFGRTKMGLMPKTQWIDLNYQQVPEPPYWKPDKPAFKMFENFCHAFCY